MSPLLVSAIQDVEECTGKPIVFLDISTHPNWGTHVSQVGLHKSSTPEDRIWLSPVLPQQVSEAVAAHELMHALQRAQGFCQTASLKRDGNPIFPAITELSVNINSLVNDTLADKWASERGFNIDALLQLDRDGLPDMERKRVVKQEYDDWERYNKEIELLLLRHNLGSSGPFEVPPESRTQYRAVIHANHYLRRAPYGSYQEFQDYFARHWPIANSLAQELLGVISKTGIDSREHCEASMIAVVKYLRMNPEIIRIICPCTGRIVWPIV